MSGWGDMVVVPSQGGKGTQGESSRRRDDSKLTWVSGTESKAARQGIKVNRRSLCPSLVDTKGFRPLNGDALT